MADFQPGAMLYTQSFASRPEGVEVPVYQTRAPTTEDWNFPVGKNWIDQVGLASYVLLSVTSSAGINTATWENTSGGATSLDTLTGDSGGAISPSSGNINLLGTANQITTTGSGSTITWTIPSAFIAPGSVQTTTSLTVGTTVTATGGAASFGGGTFTVASGTNAINISNDASATTVNVGTGSAAKTTTIGSTTTTSTTNIAAGSGNVNMNSINVVQSRSSAGVAVTNQVTNSDNTSGASSSSYQVATGGASSGDPYIDFLVSGAGHFALGIDNSDSDNFKLSASGTLGTSDVLIVTSTGDTSIAGDLSLTGAASQILINGGAATDFIGTATLSAGTVTVANTNIAAADVILVTREGINGSTALGVFNTAISAATSFTITALNPTDATTQTNDTSIVKYVIIRQT